MLGKAALRLIRCLIIPVVFAVLFTPGSFAYASHLSVFVNPSCTVDNGIQDSVWTNVTNPTFTFTNIDSDTSGYYIYLGTASDGTDESEAAYLTVATPTFSPTLPSPGKYYFRISAKRTDGSQAPWSTIFNYWFDNQPPNFSGLTITESSNVISNTWQTVTDDPNFTSISGINDAESGLNGIDVYWGSDPGGTSTDLLIGNTLNPDLIPTDIPYYLRLKASDNVGNTTDWTTAFIYKYDDGFPPDAVASPVTESHGLTSPTAWQNAINLPSFTWTPVSGAAGYQVVWDTSPTSETYTLVTSSTFTPSAPVITSTYYLRIRSIDAAANVSPWADLFTFNYDNTPPELVISVVETNNLPSGVCQSTTRNVTFSWTPPSDSGAGVIGYYTYWGADPNGISTTYQINPVSDQLTADPGGKYYYRLSTIDGAGNQSAWTTTFILCHAEVVTTVTQAAGGTLGFSPGIGFDTIVTFPIPPAEMTVADFYAREWIPEHPPIIPGYFELAYGSIPFTIAGDDTAGFNSLTSADPPFTISVHIPPESTLSLENGDVQLYRWDPAEGQGWKVVQNSFYNPVDNTLTATASRFTTYAVLGVAIPDDQRLSIHVSPISFGNIKLTGFAQTLQASPTWEILDARRTNTGWHVTISATQFSDAEGHSIPLENFKVLLDQSAITCSLCNNELPSSQMSIPNSLLDSAQTLLFSTSGMGSGRFEIRPSFSVDLPVTLYKGNFSNKVFVTIISGP